MKFKKNILEKNSTKVFFFLKFMKFVKVIIKQLITKVFFS